MQFCSFGAGFWLWELLLSVCGTEVYCALQVAGPNRNVMAARRLFKMSLLARRPCVLNAVAPHRNTMTGRCASTLGFHALESCRFTSKLIARNASKIQFCSFGAEIWFQKLLLWACGAGPQCVLLGACANRNVMARDELFDAAAWAVSLCFCMRGLQIALCRLCPCA